MNMFACGCVRWRGMRRGGALRSVITGLLWLLALTALQAQAREVRVGVYQNAPKILADQEGNPTGMLGALLEEIAAKEGWTLVPVRCNWDDCLDLLQAQEIDLMPDMAYSAARAEVYDFHRVSPLRSWSQIYQPPGVKLSSWLDLDNKRLAVLDGSIQQDELKKTMTGFGLNTTLVRATSLDEGFAMARDRVVDAAVANQLFGDLKASDYGLTASDIVFLPVQFYYVTLKGHNADLLPPIDRHLQTWLADPDSIYYQLKTQWTGVAEPSRVPTAIWWGLAGLATALLLALLMGVTLRRQVARQTRDLRASEARMTDILNNVDAYIYIKDRNGCYLYANRKVCTLFGLPLSNILGRDDTHFFDDTSDATLRQNDRRVLDHGERMETEDHLRTRGGTRSVLCLSVKIPLYNTDGSIYALCGISSDLSRQKASEAAVHQLAFYDPLTRLPNRRLLMEQLQQMLEANRHHHQCGALLLVDIDHFKDINDTLGHAQGDSILQWVADRLRDCTRAEDMLARQGDDEFVLLLPGLSAQAGSAAEQAEQVARKILTTLSAPYPLSSGPYACTVSIGVAMFNDADRLRDVLLKQADFAVQRAKIEGRNTLRFYDPQMQAQVSRRSHLEAELRQALAQGELVLHYQPQVDRHGAWLGAEALVRWQHPQRGMVPPGDFIPAAEASGLIFPLGQWVLHAACTQLAAWATHANTAEHYLAVNVSPHELQSPDFVANVLKNLQATGANPLRLELEITESHLVHDVEAAIAKMSVLREHGVRFSLDDFGTGYSSLSMLKRLPLDQIKIDQSFVQDLLGDADNAAIVSTIVTLSRSLKLDVIAEGVETAEQRDALLALGCDHFQGYLFGRPAPLPPQASTGV